MNEAERVVGPDERRFADYLKSPRFLVGVSRGHWRPVLIEWPIAIIAIAYTGPDGKTGPLPVRFGLAGYPAEAPEADLWDLDADAQMDAGKRPSWDHRTQEAFKSWGDNRNRCSVYRAWERRGMRHNNWATRFPG